MKHEQLIINGVTYIPKEENNDCDCKCFTFFYDITPNKIMKYCCTCGKSLPIEPEVKKPREFKVFRSGAHTFWAATEFLDLDLDMSLYKEVAHVIEILPDHRMISKVMLTEMLAQHTYYRKDSGAVKDMLKELGFE